MQLIRLNRFRPASLLLLATLPLGGCGTDSSAPADPYTRVAVAGTVTLDGNPLSEGTIQLDPAADTKGPTAAGEIHQGKFAIDKTQGPVAGKYLVRISGRPIVKISEGTQPGGTPKVTPDPVPSQFNTKSKLETDVPADGSSNLEFALKK
ncbi:hypothetical protein [Singulisphaera acidiphila]|uniref:Carboxypeptidase regulatory-like domain-containing protein n=1 Tax=Singulisphaera acidiphila (strain ATCC BAA-1392 / DSM 18658 / VKM B-2454 / MOB10) TaxID=886293 RepID=L0D7Y7_SINAD|nr:hypothetical protein [Singulisphaera acidiphila]AGA25519.1 hypothetical protein Sinac_1123 [Singulisphaera acidiphila DSM 18658]